MTPEQIAELEALAAYVVRLPSGVERANAKAELALFVTHNLPAILAALKAQQPDAQAEPVAWLYNGPSEKQQLFYGSGMLDGFPGWTETPLYAHPPKEQQPGEDVVERVAIRDITGERERQITDEHWSPEHDDKHSGGEMAMAAACYAYGEIIDTQTGYCLWPWFEDWWKPADTRRNLVKAGALIVAEIERLDRAAIAAMQESRDD